MCEWYNDPESPSTVRLDFAFKHKRKIIYSLLRNMIMKMPCSTKNTTKQQGAAAQNIKYSNVMPFKMIYYYNI